MCRPQGAEAPRFISTNDETGALVSLHDLERTDTAAFHNVHSSIQAEFSATLQAQPSDEHEAYVWFHVDGSDEPPKEWLAAEPSDDAETTLTRETRMRARARTLAARLAEVPNLRVEGPG